MATNPWRYEGEWDPQGADLTNALDYFKGETARFGLAPEYGYLGGFGGFGVGPGPNQITILRRKAPGFSHGDVRRSYENNYL